MNTYITNHMDDIKRALLDDKEAARRLTDAGVLVPCMCGAPMTDEAVEIVMKRFEALHEITE